MWPAVFPEGQGNDFAGWVAELGDGVGEFTVGDEVIGYLPRRAQADYVVSPADVLAPKPADISWEVAAPLSAVGVTAWAAVDAVEPKPGDTVVVSGAAAGSAPSPCSSPGCGARASSAPRGRTTPTSCARSGSSPSSTAPASSTG